MMIRARACCVLSVCVCVRILLGPKLVLVEAALQQQQQCWKQLQSCGISGGCAGAGAGGSSGSSRNSAAAAAAAAAAVAVAEAEAEAVAAAVVYQSRSPLCFLLVVLAVGCFSVLGLACCLLFIGCLF